MSRKKRRLRRERLKNALILLLTASALLLLVRLADSTGLSGVYSRLSGAESVPGALESREVAVQCAKPLAIAVTAAGGERRGVRYDGAALEEVYERYAAALAEALGSAGDPEAVTAEVWEQALGGTGVFLDFVYAQPLRALAAWLGTSMSGGAAEHAAARMCLAESDGQVFFYYIRARDQGFYRCRTLASLSPELSAGEANGASFAFEAAENAGLDPYALLIGTLPRLAGYTVRNPLRSGFSPETLLETFEMNAFVASHYGDADEVFVEGEATLRLSADGELIFRQNGNTLLAMGTPEEPATLEAAADAAYRLAEAATASTRGSCELTLSGASYSQTEDSFVLSFQYLLDGVLVLREDGQPAAEITVSAGHIVRAEILLRGCFPADESPSILPERQGLALIRAAGGGEPMLCYLDNGESLRIGWTIFERE